MAGSRKQRASTGLLPLGFAAPNALARVFPEPPEADPLLPDLLDLQPDLPDCPPIAGIGASAGRAGPVEALLRLLPSDTGLAFVVIQHADRRDQRLAAAALGRETSMSVIDARTGTVPKPNHIYIAPPEGAVTIRRNALEITPVRARAKRRRPIDGFLRSLAADRRSAAIGVVLSGPADDGIAGLKAIKAEGGLTFLQENAPVDGPAMGDRPQAGFVDCAGPPRTIARRLDRIARHPLAGLRQPERAGKDDAEFKKILEVLRAASGVDFSQYRPSAIRRRIARRMVLGKVDGLGKYAAQLQSNSDEIQSLLRDILVQVTSFFRDPEIFRILKRKLFPKIIAMRAASTPVRIWVPGCASGEEVYSIAICLLEQAGNTNSAPDVEIFGTDVSDAAIEEARTGIYSGNAVEGVSAARLSRYFFKTRSGYQIAKGIRDMCVFARHNLISDPPFSRLNLISCRNVLLYLAQPPQRNVLSNFHYSLLDHGYLLLGKPETLAANQDLFSLAERRAKLYAKKPSPVRASFSLPPRPAVQAASKPVAEAAAALELQREADRLVWEQHQHAGLIVNDAFEIVHFRGDASRYLAPVPGKATLNVLKMVCDDLALPLRGALQRAKRDNKTARAEAIRLSGKGANREVNILVAPMSAPSLKERHYLILLDQTVLPKSGKPARAKRGAEPPERVIGRLREQLATTRVHMRTIIEEQQATNEELKSANEAILSGNEELHSANEELETAKEVLQSTNDELIAVNEQLQKRNAELTQSSGDLSNVLGSVNLPILIVGGDGRIRRFTHAAAALLDLHPADADRPISEVPLHVSVDRLDELIFEVARTQKEQEREVRDRKGRWFLLRIRPYRTVSGLVDGVLLVFVDIDGMKRASEAVHEREEMVRALLDTASQAIIAVDPCGQIVIANETALRMFGYSGEGTLGQPIEKLVPEQLRDSYRERRSRFFASRTPQLGPIRDTALRADGSEFPVELTLRCVRKGEAAIAVAFVTDLSERERSENVLHQTEAALRESHLELRRLAGSLLRAQEEERRRISSELHDDLNQKLALLAVEVDAIAQQLGSSRDATRTGIQRLRRSVDEVSDRMRGMAYRLHPSVLDHLGLFVAVRSLCDDYTSKGIDVRMRRAEMPDAIPDDVALCVYRVIQESLVRVAAEPPPRAAAIVMTGDEDRITVSITDSIVGGGTKTAPRESLASDTRGDLSWVSLKERVRLVKGTITMKYRPGGGTRLVVSIPLKVDQEERAQDLGGYKQ